MYENGLRSSIMSIMVVEVSDTKKHISGRILNTYTHRATYPVQRNWLHKAKLRGENNKVSLVDRLPGFGFPSRISCLDQPETCAGRASHYFNIHTFYTLHTIQYNIIQ
jgi:hypothetical protein